MITYLVGATLGLQIQATMAQPKHITVTEECPVTRTGDVCPLCGGRRYLASIGFGAIDRPCPRCAGEQT